ncbi:hypothetical protein CRX72_17965 [Pantoea sp. BRM17]|nr:hypothetical protein CRX72_17965 [Pantoea sp. BRM17]
MHGVGRIGAILSAFAGAELLTLGWAFSQIFLLLAIPAALTTLMLVLKYRFADPKPGDAGWLMDRMNASLALATIYFCGGIAIVALGFSPAQVGLMSAIAFCSGFCFNGANTGMNALSAHFYPTAIATVVSESYLFGSLMLWGGYFMGLFLVYLIGSWLPSLINTLGMSLTGAAIVTAMYQAGGTLGSLLVLLMGGILPLLVLPWLMYGLPESVRFLIHQRAPAARIHAILERMLPGEVAPDSRYHASEALNAQRGQMMLFRFLTGLGLGAAMPNVGTLVAEYAPERRRSFIITVVFCGFTFGAAAGGFAASWLLPRYSWHAPALKAGWGVTNHQLGMVISAALIGLALGAMVAGPLADRYGRRIMILLSVLFFGLWTLATALAQNIDPPFFLPKLMTFLLNSRS